MFCTLLAIFAIAADEPDAEALTRSLIEITKETTAALKAVTDRATAEKAKPRLEDFHARYERFRKDLADRPDEEREALPKRLADDRVKQDEALTQAHNAVFAKHKDAYKVLAETGVFKRVEAGLEYATLVQMQKVEQGCKAYFLINDGEWPTVLRDLVVKIDGKPPLLEGGLKSVTDPWGAPFRYEVVPDAFVGNRPRIWMLYPYGDGKKVLVWPPEGKK